MSKIEIGRYSERLRRALGMKGQEIVSGELSPEISPVIVIEDNSAQWQFLQGVRLCQSSAIETATVAQNTVFRYVNPATSGILAQFSLVQMATGIVSDVTAGYGLIQTPFGTQAATGLRDHRWVAGGTVATAILGSRGNGVALGFSQGIFNTRVLADSPFKYEQQFIILPGESLELGTFTVNVDVAVTLAWTERTLPSLEQ